MHDGPPTPDRVAAALAEAQRLLLGGAGPDEVAAFDERLATLDARELVRFDWQARTWSDGLSWMLPKRRFRRVQPALLWPSVALVAQDGRVREAAIAAAPLTPVHVRLLVLRCLDWAEPVRAAALRRLETIDPELLLDALPLAELLAVERVRGQALSELLDQRLPDDLLRRAAGSHELVVRRGAWRRLGARRALLPADIDRLTTDSDGVVRALAAAHLPSLPAEDRRRAATALLDDPVGKVASRALAVLVALDGDAPVVAALTVRTAAGRRAARDWAGLRGIDARAVYLRRVTDDPQDALALTGLAELADPEDRDLFATTVDDERTRIAAAALRALTRTDEHAGRTAALAVLHAGRGGRLARTAADALRDRTPSDHEAHVLEALARDTERPTGERLRALSLLRPLRWRHLVVLLEIRAADEDLEWRAQLEPELDTWLRRSAHLGVRPAPALAQRLDAVLPTLDDERRREAITFVLRTARR